MPLKRFPAVLFTLMTQLVRAGSRSWWLSGLFWLAIVAPAQAALELRVAIEDGARQVKVGSSTKAVLRDGSGRPLGEIAAMNAFIAEPSQGKIALDRWQSGQIWVEPTGGGYVFIGDRWYRGRALVVPAGSGLTAVNYVDLEQYLYSVLGGEMNGNWPQEALKAQAVAARSYALYQRQSAANEIYDVGDTAGWQVYDGIEDESTGTQAAVNATAGQVLTHNGQIIEAVFHSSAGGCTENVEDVWVQALPYLRSVPDFDQGSPVYQWTKNFSRSELSARITGVGNILALTPVKTTQCGRVMSMYVEGDAGMRTMKGDELRSALGLRSTLFTVVPEVAKDKAQSAPVGFQVIGRGFGHGLGMSQWGAYNLATRGTKYHQILLHYYKGTTLAKIQVK
jgi:stage II sporulation protein D